MTLVKSNLKKSFGQKTILPIENLPKSLKNRFFGKTFLGEHFTIKHKTLAYFNTSTAHI
jgi:hypothetical protein